MREDSTTPLILIADADTANCRVFEAKLTREKYRTVSVTTSVEALQAAMKEPYDVLLWDVHLRDTFDLLPRIRALCPHSILILMTTDDQATLDPELRRLDVTDVLTKPFGLETLAERIRRALHASLTSVVAAKVDLVQIGQLLTLISPAGDCMTRVLDSNQDSFLVVGAPRVETPPDFAPGLRVQVIVNGSDAVYSFPSRLIGFEEHPVAHWELHTPRTIRREQRRKVPRLALHLPVLLSSEPNLQGVTEDVSMTGCAIVADHPLQIGSQVHFSLQHPTQGALEGEGEVVRIQPMIGSGGSLSTPRTQHYRIALHFQELSLTERRRLRSLLQISGR